MQIRERLTNKSSACIIIVFQIVYIRGVLMRRLFAAFLAVLFCLGSSIAFADGIDFSSMTEQELLDVIDMARLELTKYQAYATDGTVLYEDEHIKITLNGDLEMEYASLVMHVIIENYSDKNLIISFDHASCNGWDIYEATASVNAQKKARCDVSFYDAGEAADLTGPEDVEDISCQIRYFDEDDWEFSVDSEEPLVWLFGE